MSLGESIKDLVKSLKRDVKSIRYTKDYFIECLEGSPLLIKENVEKVAFIGDLHGDLKTLLNLSSLYSKEDCLLIFLGDYVDRGPYQLETLLGVLILKQRFKERVIILRGNHEHSWMNFHYGFIMELNSKLGSEWKLFYKEFVLEVYKSLPIAVLITVDKKRIFGVHGGIPITIPSLRDISMIDLVEDVFENPLLMQMLWNDPSEEVDTFAPSVRGEGVYYFGRKVLEPFLSKNRINLVVRAHEPVASGVQALFNRKLFTVFSCRYYGITPALLEINSSSERIVTIS